MSSYNPFSLVGKTVLVTGASSGIGQTTAIECSKLGATVVITGRNQERLQETFAQLEGDGHLQFTGELTNEADVNALVDFCPALDGLVLCAGRGMTLPLNFATREKWNAVFDVNFFAPMELIRLCLKKKRLMKGSSVVFITSVSGVKSFDIANGIYGASKAALDTAMKFYVKELASKKIRLNSIAPAMVETPLIHGKDVNWTEEQLKADMARYPLGHYGSPNDVALGVIYLLSDAASWITGHTLVIDGGFTVF
jgi:NAD(P)-dependent dehydrogenase (short-subunit alcohol dehydrogenase family)